MLWDYFVGALLPNDRDPAGPKHHCADRAMGRLRMFVELALEKFQVPGRDFLDRNSVPITQW